MKVIARDGFKFSPMLVIALGIISFAGCQKETDVGGQGASGQNAGVRDNGNAENTFVLTLPSGETDITQGESETLTIGIERGEDFNQAVSVSLMATATGLSLEPAETILPANKSEIQVTLKASANAPLGLTNVTVIGKPETGESVNGGIKIQVNEKE